MFLNITLTLSVRLLFWLCEWCWMYSLIGWSDGHFARWRHDCGNCFSISLSEWIPLPWVAHKYTASLMPSLYYVFPSLLSLSVTTAPPPSLLLFFGFLTQAPFFSCFSLFHCLPSLLLSSVCSRVMVCCGLPTQRNNISGVGKVQPHMSCAAEGRLCEVRPIPHGSYSSQPRDQRPAIPLPSSSYSSSSLTFMNQMKILTSGFSPQ